MNIFQIQQELLSIYEELEENGGELTPELDEALAITQESFKDKVKSYTEIIKLLDNDITAIKEEQKRLQELSKRKTKVITKLKEIIVNAIEQFGDTKKTGAKYLDYGIGQVSIKNTEAVELCDDTLNTITDCIDWTISNIQRNNQLGVIDGLSKEDLIDTYKLLAKHRELVLDSITEDDLNHTTLSMSVDIPVKDLFTNTGYDIVKTVLQNGKLCKFTPHVSKTELKTELKENIYCAPNVARLVKNKSIIIK